jgi:hypothetical protein
VPPPLSADEARAAAAAEGLELVPSSRSETGFKGVRKKENKYEGRIQENGKQRHLGTFATPEEAALCCARHIRAERAVAETAAAAPPLSADEARAAAAAEGLELARSYQNETGFKGVKNNGKNSGRYEAHLGKNGKNRYLGTFATPEEAALWYARQAGAERGAERAAAETAEAGKSQAETSVTPGIQVPMPLPWATMRWQVSRETK